MQKDREISCIMNIACKTSKQNAEALIILPEILSFIIDIAVNRQTDTEDTTASIRLMPPNMSLYSRSSRRFAKSIYIAFPSLSL